MVPNSVRSSVDGPAKQRRRFTGIPHKCDWKMFLDETQMPTLKTFYKTTLLDVLPFDWLDFRDGTTATYRFTARPTYTWFADNIWEVTLPLEMLP